VAASFPSPADDGELDVEPAIPRSTLADSQAVRYACVCPQPEPIVAHRRAFRDIADGRRRSGQGSQKVKLTFLGTRGEIEVRRRRHWRHTSLLVSYRRRRVMVDCGADWLRLVPRIRPHAIVLTHAHPDHAWGLVRGAPCPVWATKETWASIGAYPIEVRHTLSPRHPRTIEGMRMEAFAVEHSLRAPAVGYRISAGRTRVFYAPDLVFIVERADALRGVRIYIGDGATLTRPLVRRRDDTLIGHTPVSTQLTWCAKEGVPRAIITHCGTEIVTSPHTKMVARINELAAARGVDAELAYDGLTRLVR
jgi:phosphoribosyl 1,2-cyclic phosphodiesterase